MSKMTKREIQKKAYRAAAGLIASMALDQFYGDDELDAINDSLGEELGDEFATSCQMAVANYLTKRGA